MELDPRIILRVNIVFWQPTLFNSTLAFFDVLETLLHEHLRGPSDREAQCSW